MVFQVLLGDDSPNLFEKEVVSFFQSPSMPTSCHVSMAMLNTLVNNKACAEEVTERSFGSAATCCTKAESAFSGVYEIASWSSSPQLSEKVFDYVIFTKIELKVSNFETIIFKFEMRIIVESAETLEIDHIWHIWQKIDYFSCRCRFNKAFNCFISTH